MSRQLDKWWVQLGITVGTMLVAVALGWSAMSGDVKANTLKNEEQDICLKENVKSLQDYRESLVRMDERWISVEKNMKRIITKLDKED